MTRAATARPTPAAADKPAPKPVKGYFLRSELPWTSLVFLLPFLVFYELGTRRYTADADIRAFRWMQDFFEFFHAYGRHLPALAVVGILLAWHIARRDSWALAPSHLLLMLLESFVLAIPVILLAQLSSRYMPLYAVSGVLMGKLVLSVGAGIYEELVFRLGAFTLLSLLFIDVLGIRKAWSYLLMVLISSAGFSLYHYWGFEQFQLQSFAFRTLAGVYFSVVFLYRGFGISAGSHAAYDIVVNLLSWLA
jgi:hypothetical protein